MDGRDGIHVCNERSLFPGWWLSTFVALDGVEARVELRVDTNVGAFCCGEPDGSCLLVVGL